MTNYFRHSSHHLGARRERRRYLGEVKRRIRHRVGAGGKIRVAFFVMYDSAFPALPVALTLLERKLFAPRIVLIPDTLRGHDNMVAQIEKSTRSLARHGIPVESGYDIESGEYRDVVDDYDFICTSNPYDELTHPNFGSERIRSASVLPFYIGYGFGVSNLHLTIISREFYRDLWKVFLPTRSALREFRRHSSAPPEAVEVTGYPKLDGLARYRDEATHRPTVIIAPHHTVREWPGGLELSTFLDHADDFAQLPKRYPGIDFVFRPHPLLFVHLSEDDLWGSARAEQYLNDLAANANVVVDSTPDYLELFARSAALIHDSGSFVAEYLFTGKPALFIAREGRDPSEQFNRLGRECLRRHYRATSMADICGFIESVVLGGRDPMAVERRRFSRRSLMTNYPHAADRVVARLESVLR